jgi:hypothetical protein
LAVAFTPGEIDERGYAWQGEGCVIGRVLRTGLSSLRDRAASRLAALRFNPSRRYEVVTLFRYARPGEVPGSYREMERKRYRCRWMAEMAARPRIFIAKLAPNEYGIILSRVEKAP